MVKLFTLSVYVVVKKIEQNSFSWKEPMKMTCQVQLSDYLGADPKLEYTTKSIIEMPFKN